MSSSYPRASATVEPSSRRHATPDVYIYLAVLSFLFMTPGSLGWTPLQFIYKNELHMSAHQAANFKFLINVPGMLAFTFGILRDRYNPLRMGDRGFIVLFGALSGLVFLGLSSSRLTVFTLGVGLVLWGIAIGLVAAAFQALMRNIAEARMMSGRMSTLNQFMGAGVAVLMLLAGGWLTDHVSWRVLLTIVGSCYIALALCGLWKPKDVFVGIPSGGNRSFAELGVEIKLLTRYRGYWVAVLIWGIWAFAPAAGTPFMYFFTDTLKGNGTQFGVYNSIWSFASIPAILLFGFFCKRMSLWRLLLVSTVVAIPQWFPVMFIHSVNETYALAIFAGVTGGLASTAYYGLIFRACPEGLAGSGMLVAGSLALIVAEAGNVFGGYLFERAGFIGCAIATTVAYALMLPLCFLVPRALVEPPDDKPVPTEEELVAA